VEEVDLFSAGQLKGELQTHSCLKKEKERDFLYTFNGKCLSTEDI